ncbi:unnamed protein product [Effrenium voratum]|nr:unnamed protein product [Effrenium voratum]
MSVHRPLSLAKRRSWGVGSLRAIAARHVAPGEGPGVCGSLTCYKDSSFSCGLHPHCATRGAKQVRTELTWIAEARARAGSWRFMEPALPADVVTSCGASGLAPSVWLRINSADVVAARAKRSGASLTGQGRKLHALSTLSTLDTLAARRCCWQYDAHNFATRCTSGRANCFTFNICLDLK